MVATAVVLLGVSGSAGATAAVSPSAPPGSAEIPVLGSTVVTFERSVKGPQAVALVHGVRRIPGATVLYFSVGLPAGSPGVVWAGGLTHIQRDQRYAVNTSTLLGNLQLVDVGGKRVYSVLVDAQKNALASPLRSWPADGASAGSFYELYEVLPELPAGLGTVDVMIGNNDVVHSVPVTDGVLEPAVPQTGPLKLGQGWPEIDQAAAASSVTPEQSIRELNTETSDLEQTVVKRETPDSVSVDLAADVLFAVDKATLGSAAEAKIQAAADQINANASGGRIQVVGHTDSTGTPAYNDDLSKRRAQAVAAVLKPLVTVPGVTFAVEGRGEREPVSSNESESGRKQNRRVSVVFAPKAGQ